jgi:hypothetical protein
LKFDPATQTSEVSLLKDIVSGDTQNKFHAKNLQEIKSIGFSYRSMRDGLFKNTGQMLNKKMLFKTT